LLSCYANRSLSESQLQSLALWSATGYVVNRPNALLFLARRLQDEACPAIDAVEIADRFALLLLTDPASAWADAAVYSGLAILENSLQRFDKALAYAQLSLDREPDSPPALLMKLHFSTALNKKAIVTQTKKKLSLLAAQGKLSLQQQQTLELYVKGN